ncbi:polyadenylate-binding protein 2-B-like isoform X2 [Saccoglossus kowalevskii]|uniref:Polyadenylate-binding protein 2-B-like isoform X2 n=1 Tax=Saccoglossus kowalevskii TaxID=10224 RepID=A0ABM0MEF9_SACKO|nr:PREDICTED: polyadenylate-binding protein 2-B-like isoform X2 [Saccoglossus kowalevskii]
MAANGEGSFQMDQVVDQEIVDPSVGVDFGVGDEGNDENVGVAEEGVEDPELEAIKARVREMEEEAEKLKEMQNEVEKQMNMTSPTQMTPISLEDKVEVDARSVYVGNVDYSATAEELEAHFHGCGSVNRVTILCDKFTGHPKGFAYIEYADKDSVQTSLALDESLFKGRQIKVLPKRTNRPGISTTNRGPRGRGFRRGARAPFNMQYYSGYVPRPRGSRFRYNTGFFDIS